MDDTHGAPAPLTMRALASLAELAARLRAAGHPDPQSPPWLVAELDQHAAEVRDALSDEGGRLRLVRLAGYAEGVLDTAERNGWTLRRADGPAVPWPVLRLLAVCSLAPAAR